MMIVLDASAAVGMVSRTPEGIALAQLLLRGEKVISHDLNTSAWGKRLVPTRSSTLRRQ